MYITKEQKEKANQVDLVSYLISKGYELVKRGNSYKLKISKKYSGDMSSLSIFENRKGWKRWSTGEHGGDAISFLEKNMNMTFQDAVLELTGNQSFSHSISTPRYNKSSENIKKEFKLPEKTDGKYSRLFAYLTQTRKIDPYIIAEMIKEKKIYQDKRNNIVFVGYNEKKQPAFACVRGTNTTNVFKGDCDGSDKKYAFSIEGTNKNKLYIFESPIDLLSHATMTNKIINHEKAWTVHSRICLSGTSDVALEHFLESHPDIKELYFYLDNDVAGRNASEKYCKKYSEKGFKTIELCPKGKDVNEDLIEYVNSKSPPQQNMSIKTKR